MGIKLLEGLAHCANFPQKRPFSLEWAIADSNFTLSTTRCVYHNWESIQTKIRWPIQIMLIVTRIYCADFPFLPIFFRCVSLTLRTDLSLWTTMIFMRNPACSTVVADMGYSNERMIPSNTSMRRPSRSRAHRKFFGFESRPGSKEIQAQ